MRRYLAAAIAAAVFSSHAGPIQAQSSVAAMLKPSPWSIGITLIQWAMKDRERVLYIEVTAEGSDLDDARRRAFRMAVERAVGTVISAETESQNSRLARDEIITYASGYVKDYQLVETNPLADRTQVRMKIWVSPNKLANRLLNKSQADGIIEGGKIGQQIESLQYERATGDRLLLSVLADYPGRAFDVRVLPTKVTMDQNRSPVLHVFVDLSWNDKYLDSLGTAVKSINQKQGCDRFFKPLECDRATVHIKAGPGQAWMDDQSAWHLFLRETITSKPQLLLTFFDQNGRWLFKQCVGVNELDHVQYAPHHYVEVAAGRVLVNAGLKKRLEIPIPIGTYPISPSGLDRVDARVVRNTECR